MNLQSIRWAFNAGRQHCADPAQLALLLVIASAVDQRHEGCVLTVQQLAEACVMSPSEVEAHLAALKKARLIRKGDPALVATYPAERRPVVWNLAHADRSEPRNTKGRERQNLPFAVYRFYDADNRLLYVGMTLDRDLRWNNHASTKAWWPQVARQEVTWYETKRHAREAEREAISAEGPIYNRRG